MKVLFLINPRSGVRRQADIAALIGESCRELAADHELQACGRIEDLDSIIDRAEREKFEVIYAVGGDGTVHEIGKRLIGRNLTLGILATGSGNGFARHLGLPAAPRDSLAACHSGATITVDTAEVNGLPFLGVLGLGLDAVIAERFASSSVRGLRTYVVEGLRALGAFAPERYEIEVDGASFETSAYVVAVANSSQYGNNARIAPIASLQDGLLDVVTVERLSILSAPMMLVRLFNGTLNVSRSVSMKGGREIMIRRERPGPAHLDGEPLTLPRELRIGIRPRSLKVLVPSGATRV